MARIKLLPDEVKNKIAAGEIVEGPFSVVKELVENSIDAGATQIDIQVLEGGLKKIFVRDNGSGIHHDDMRLALTEHATSKIGDIHDIERIASYGFRGEALSSISSVSSLAIVSRRPDEDMGSRLSRSGAGYEATDFAGESGTTVIVENFLYNVPARKKFLKAMATELRAVRETVLKLAIPNPHIAFALDVDGKRQITLGPAESVGQRIGQIHGSGIMNDLYHAALKDIKIEASGFFSKPHYLKSSRAMQLMYVNNRPIEYKYLGFLLSRAYEAVAPRGRFPAGIIFIDIDPGLVDVNIHPAKKEVKFFDGRYIDRLIMSLAEKALNREHKIQDRLFAVPEMEKGPGDRPGSVPASQGAVPSDNATHDNDNGYAVHAGPGPARPSAMVRDLAELYHDVGEANAGRALGIAFGTYVILERNNSLFFIDFHAAHERIIYDALVAKEHVCVSQRLAFPPVVELSIDDHALVLENIEKFSEIGFDIEDFSDNSIKISAVPDVAREADAVNIIMDFIQSVRDERETKDAAGRMAAAVACHAAKRAGDRLSESDVDLLVSKALRQGGELRCPHGRPFVYSIGKEDIERMFKR